jgi:hypothetical protein
MKKMLIVFNSVVLILVLLGSTCIERRTELTKEQVTGKWEVSNSSRYKSFEFTESGNYIVIRKSSSKSTADEVEMGVYDFGEDGSIILPGFGEIENFESTGNSANFDVNDESYPGDPEPVLSIKSAQYQETTKTELLCKTWKVVSFNGKSTNPGNAKEILFSRSGTYLVSYLDGTTGLSSWQWKDNKEEYICYSWYGNPSCNGSNEVKVYDLTESSCKLNEDGDIWIFEVVVNKSAEIKSIIQNITNPNSFVGR